MRDELTPIQIARNIVADAFVREELNRKEKPAQFATFMAWGEHIDSYSRFMREGAYDSNIAVQSALIALSRAGAA